MLSREFYKPGMLIIPMALVLVMLVAGCGKNTTNEIRTISSVLSGKWEISKIVLSGTEHPLPYSGVNSGGYLFTSDSLTSYINGSVSFTMPGVYAENSRLYASDGQAGYSYKITGNTLNVVIDESSGIVATKVWSFSWEK